ncbi:uncharacterized protein LOC142320291 [Lycorma delicatula]|uniref:uncharacterized protein LOC142320291 n=1 Tax=Lycorma delicatula TaxID=130591 RepID=UPI003F512728
MGRLCVVLILASIALISLAQDEIPQEEENFVLQSDDTDEKIPEITKKPSTKSSKPPRELIIKFINDLFQIPITLLKTVSNVLSAGLESFTSSTGRNSNKT